MNPLLQVRQFGQQIWLDNLSRTLLNDGHLARFINEDGVTGITTYLAFRTYSQEMLDEAFHIGLD